MESFLFSFHFSFKNSIFFSEKNRFIYINDAQFMRTMLNIRRAIATVTVITECLSSEMFCVHTHTYFAQQNRTEIEYKWSGVEMTMNVDKNENVRKWKKRDISNDNTTTSTSSGRFRANASYFVCNPNDLDILLRVCTLSLTDTLHFHGDKKYVQFLTLTNWQQCLLTAEAWSLFVARWMMKTKRNQYCKQHRAGDLIIFFSIVCDVITNKCLEKEWKKGGIVNRLVAKNWHHHHCTQLQWISVSLYNVIFTSCHSLSTFCVI